MYRSRPKPNGCAGFAARRARRPPISSRAWLAESATECTDSASIELDPVSVKATNLVTAIPRLAESAAMIAFWLPAVDTQTVPEAGWASSTSSTGMPSRTG